MAPKPNAASNENAGKLKPSTNGDFSPPTKTTSPAEPSLNGNFAVATADQHQENGNGSAISRVRNDSGQSGGG